MTRAVTAAEAREEHTDTTLSILLLLFLFFFLYVGLEIGFAGWITTYGEEIGFSDLAATWLTTMFWIGFTSGRLLASVLAHRVRPDTMLYAACDGVGAGGSDPDRRRRQHGVGVDRHGDDGPGDGASVPGHDEPRRAADPHLRFGHGVVRRWRRGGRVWCSRS